MVKQRNESLVELPLPHLPARASQQLPWGQN